jgi:hypothetical protein
MDDETRDDEARDDGTRAGATPGIPPEPLAPTEARVIGPVAAATRETVRRVLAKLEIPDYEGVLAVWHHMDGSVEIQLTPRTFWRTVHRAGLAVTSTEYPEWRYFPYRHVFTVDGIDCLTLSAEPVLPPGVLTPGYALRLT